MNILLLGPATGLAHSMFCLFLSLIFLEALLFRYGRIPFTCAFDSGNTNLGIALFVWFSLFLVYVYGTTAIEVRLLARPPLFVCSLVLLYIGWRLLIHARECYTELGRALEFSDDAFPQYSLSIFRANSLVQRSLFGAETRVGSDVEFRELYLR